MDSQINNHDPDLDELLNSWALDHHYEHFLREKLTLKHLRLLQPKHIEKLFDKWPVADQVMFEHHLEIWKRTMLLNNDFSSSTTTSQQDNGTTTTASRKSSSVPNAILSDDIRDMDLLVANENNDTDDSYVDETNDVVPHSFHISTPTPRVLVATPYTVPPAAAAGRNSHASSVPSVTAVGPTTPVAVREPIQIASYTGSIPYRYDLMKILTETNGGQMVLNYYAKHLHLSEEHRKALINVIACHIDANGCTLSLSESNQLETQILQVFPTEKAEFYRTSKRGRLYNKISNMKTIYKKITKDIERTPSVTAGGIKEEEGEEDVDEYNKYIIHDLRAKAQTTGNFLEFWKTTQAMRLKNIDEIEYLQDILEKWPEYKEANAMKYISMDFYAKHPTATKFSQVFNDSIGKLEKLLFTKVSTGSASFKNLKLYQKSTKECQHLIILWLMHHIFPRKKRYSIQDSQHACICIRSSLALIDNFLHNKETATPPMLLVVGELNLDIQEIFVYFEGIRYPMNSVAHAAELCLELFFLFKIDFPVEALVYYNFVQTYFMNIEPDVKNSKIYTTIDELNAY